MGTPDEGRSPSPAVDRALRMLETLVASDEPMTLTALAQANEVPLATAASIVQTLELRGYATRHVVGRSHFWRPTMKLNALAAQVSRRIDLPLMARPYLQHIVDETHMAAHLGTLDGATVTYVAKVSAPGMMQFNTFPGKTAPFNLTALGRAIVAFLPEDRAASLAEQAVPGVGPRGSAATGKKLLRMLAEVRLRGYAVEDEEEEPGIGCVATPFFGADGAVKGSMGVTGLASQVRGADLERVAASVSKWARAFSHEQAAPNSG